MMKTRIDWISLILLIIFSGIFILGIKNLFEKDNKKPVVYKFEPMRIQTTIYTCSDTITINDTILIK